MTARLLTLQIQSNLLGAILFGYKKPPLTPNKTWLIPCRCYSSACDCRARSWMLFLSRQHNSPPSIVSLFPRKRRGRRGEHRLCIKFQNCHQRSSHFSHLCLFMFSFFFCLTPALSQFSAPEQLSLPHRGFSPPRSSQPFSSFHPSSRNLPGFQYRTHKHP